MADMAPESMPCRRFLLDVVVVEPDMAAAIARSLAEAPLFTFLLPGGRPRGRDNPGMCADDDDEVDGVVDAVVVDGFCINAEFGMPGII